MNKITYIASLGIMLLLGSSACKKQQPSPADKLVGDWKWVRSFGGFTGKQVLKPTPGKETIYRFTHDGQWTTCTNGICTSPTPFTLRQEKSLLFGDERLVLTLRRRIQLAPPDTGSHLLLSRYLVIEIADSLLIDQDAPDGFSESYSHK